jgi:hypothetical protein
MKTTQELLDAIIETLTDYVNGVMKAGRLPPELQGLLLSVALRSGEITVTLIADNREEIERALSGEPNSNTTH